MRQRVMIAMMLGCEPDVLVADEPTTALDVTVQAQVLRLLRDLQVRRNMAMILVSHDLGVVGSVADEIAVMYAGRVIERGARELVIEHPRHPYTHALLRSVPRLDLPLGSRLLGIKGRPPDLRSVPPGCAFAPRCEYADEVCREMAPSLAPEAEGRLVACWKPVAGADNAARIGGAGADYAGE